MPVVKMLGQWALTMFGETVDESGGSSFDLTFYLGRSLHGRRLVRGCVDKGIHTLCRVGDSLAGPDSSVVRFHVIVPSLVP